MSDSEAGTLPPDSPPDTAERFAPPDDAVADFTPPESAPGYSDGDEYLNDSIAAQAIYDRAVSEVQRGDENDALLHFLRASKLAEAAREWYLAAAACHRVGEMYHTPGRHYDLARAVRVYHRAIAAYQQCGLFDEARHLTYRVASLRLWNSGEMRVPPGQRVGLFLFWAVAGFGLRPLRVLGTAAVLTFGYAIAYWAIGGVMSPHSAALHGHDFSTALYFSGITFTTVGFGDLIPAPHARLLAISEGMIGFATVSFFIVVLANRLRT